MDWDHFDNRADRARIFAPFDALKGFREALAAKERLVASTPEYYDDYKEELERTLTLLRPDDKASVLLFTDGAYTRITGVVDSIDCSRGFLIIDGQKAEFRNICRVERG